MRRTEQRRAAVFALYQRDVTLRPLEIVLAREAKPFTHELAEGVDAHLEELDDLIGRHAEGWTIERIAPLERNLLRVALFEMLHRDDVPDEVAIDEAVEAAKELCGAEAPGFVNGILGAVKRAQETAA
jgi:N utilization substance protein B